MKNELRVGIFVFVAVIVFLYLSFNIGAWRMDHKDHETYITYFDDTGGLGLKALVKTSGVKVGWVDNIQLRDGGKAEVHLKVHKEHRLALNAYAIIQQDGLIGEKYIELDPGEFSTGILLPGGVLSIPGKSTASVSDLIDQAREIAHNVGDVAHSVKNVIGTKDGERRLHETLDSASKATKSISNVSHKVERIVERNESSINNSIRNIEKVSSQLERNIPKISRDIHDVASNLNEKVFPEAVKMGPAFEAIEDTAIQARDGFREMGQVMEKVNTGKGVVGKLINEDETYADLRKTIRGLKEYVNRVQSLQIHLDMNSEQHFKYNQNKGYLNMKIRPASDYFYQIQLTADEFGTISREEHNYIRRDIRGARIAHENFSWSDGWSIRPAEGVDPKTVNTLTPTDYLGHPDTVEHVSRVKNAITLGFQFGKRFDRLAFRLGMFENTFGMACDFYVPLKTQWFHWLTSIEAFDFRGTKRIDDTRPHVKWVNKVMFMKNFYTSFGFDDIVSKTQATPFFGSGFRFNDSDLKYFFSLFSAVGSQ